MAKRFTFRLEPVLALRQQREDQQRRVVGERLRSLQQSRAVMRELHRTVEEALARTRRDRQDQRLDIAAALQAQRWRWYLDRRIARQHADIDRIQSVLNEERAELARRAKDRKALQMLRDRRHDEHIAAQARFERLEMDEIAAQRYVRRLQSQTEDPTGLDD